MSDDVLMSRHSVDILSTFLEAVDALNTERVAQLEHLLSPAVVMTRIHHPRDQDSLRGRDSVLKYLTKRVETHPRLWPTSPISIDSRRGTVSGRAVWEDNPRGQNIKEIIDYSFSFVLHPEGKGWLIQNMDALPH
jgi:hypothetical protein